MSNILTEGIESYDFVKRAYLKSVDTSHSSATIRIEERNGLYDELLTNIVGYEVDRSSILALLQELMTIKDEYDGISNALSMVRQTGLWLCDSSFRRNRIIKTRNY
mgnify:CR=1 FL=1